MSSGRHASAYFRMCLKAGMVTLAVMMVSACGAARRSVPTAEGGPLDRSASRANQERLRKLVLTRQRSEDGNDYVIGPGDLLTVTIYNFRPEGGNFETDVRVDDHGYISLPMIDPVRAAASSAAELRAALVVALRRSRVLNQPMVSLFLKDYQGQGVVVLGAVARPGLYHLSRGGQTLIDVVSMAGGLTQNAGNYLLLRPTESARNGTTHDAPSQESALALASATDSVADAEANMIVIGAHTGGTDPMLLALPMRSGDLVVVPEAGQAFIEGEVAKPGPVPLVYGMTLTQLISAVGGLAYPANPQQVKFIRSTGAGGSKQWTIDIDRIQRQEGPDILLERNDRVVVPSTTGRKITYGVYQTLTAIVHFTVGGAAALY